MVQTIWAGCHNGGLCMGKNIQGVEKVEDRVFHILVVILPFPSFILKIKDYVPPPPIES